MVLKGNDEFPLTSSLCSLYWLRVNPDIYVYGISKNRIRSFNIIYYGI